MNLVKNNFATTFITKTWNNDKKQYEYDWKFSKGNSKNIDRIIQDWITQTNNNFKVNTKVDKEKILVHLDKLKVLEEFSKQKQLHKKELNSAIEDLYNVLSDIGIKFTSILSLKYAIESVPAPSLQQKLRSVLSGNTFGIDMVIEKLTKNEESVDKIFKDEKGLLYLALQDSKFRKDGFESSVTGAEGNKKWIYSYGEVSLIKQQLL